MLAILRFKRIHYLSGVKIAVYNSEDEINCSKIPHLKQSYATASGAGNGNMLTSDSFVGYVNLFKMTSRSRIDQNV